MSKRHNKLRGREFLANPNFMAETEHRLALLDGLNDALGYVGHDKLYFTRERNAAKVSSGHNVFPACDMNALSGKNGNQVFVKHYMPSKGKEAQHEVENLKRAATILESTDEHGLSMHVIRPHKEGVYAVEKYGFAVTTDYLPNLVTMDHELHRMTQAEWPYALQYMGLFAGLLHGRGVISGDLQPKNIGQRFNAAFMQTSGLSQELGVSWGQPVFFDPEKSKFFDPNNNSTRQEYSQACREDVTTLLKSLVSEGYMHQNDIGNRNEFEEFVLQNFMAAYVYAGGIEDILDDDRHWNAIYNQVAMPKGYIAPKSRRGKR